MGHPVRSITKRSQRDTFCVLKCSITFVCGLPVERSVMPGLGSDRRGSLAADPAAAPSEPSSHEGATRSTLGPPPPPPRAPSSSYVTHTNEKLRRSKLEADRRRARARRQRAAGAHSASGQSLFRTGTAPSTPRAASPRASPPSTPWQKIPDLTRGANTGTRARATRPTRSMSSRGITRPGVPGAKPMRL